jgi:hypothetical protein
MKKIIVTTIFTLSSTIAMAGIMDESDKMQRYITNNPKAQKAVTQVVTPEVYGKCVPLVVVVSASEANGGALSKDETVMLGAIGGATAYYRQLQLAKGVSERLLDNQAEPYFQEAKRLSMQGYFSRYENYCITKATSFWKAATQK